MLAATPTDPSVSVLRKPSIWRRLSRRGDRPPRASTPTTDSSAPQRLQKRIVRERTASTISTNSASHNNNIHNNSSTPSKDEKKKISTPLQPIESPNTLPSNKQRITPATTPQRAIASQLPTSQFPNDSPSAIHTVPWNISITPDQVYRLFMGFAPDLMEHKWFIYSQGPDKTGKLKVHFHRSWTGIKIAELFLVIDLTSEGAGRIVGIKWNGTEQTNGMNEDEAKYMIATTCEWVLGVDFRSL